MRKGSGAAEMRDAGSSAGRRDGGGAGRRQAPASMREEQPAGEIGAVSPNRPMASHNASQVDVTSPYTGSGLDLRSTDRRMDPLTKAGSGPYLTRDMVGIS